MENILLPSKMNFTPGSKPNESIVTIEPLHHGYGTTIGNALRRVLLSSLEGAAVEAVKIKGVQHEFSTTEGVKEDILEIILNLKKLRMKVHANESVVLHLEVSGKTGVVTASEIGKNADVEITNPDLVLATMTDKKHSLIMDITVGRGRGYVMTEERENNRDDIGLISIDSLYSPVVSVSINVENTRVGEITNYDKLVMKIETDGTVTAEEAVKDSVNILLNHFNWINGQIGGVIDAEQPSEVVEDASMEDGSEE